ncbi:hypothetical protein TNCV_3885151 [Trichonephila clavipes]|nr:hypothetical protein TNCV_3885151 [Trichonephila clavipes]
MTPEVAPLSPNQREGVSALDRFNVHRCPTRRVFSGTGIELMTCLPWLDTLTTGLPQPPVPLKTRHVGERGTLSLSRAQMSSHWCGS